MRLWGDVRNRRINAGATKIVIWNNRSIVKITVHSKSLPLSACLIAHAMRCDAAFKCDQRGWSGALPTTVRKTQRHLRRLKNFENSLRILFDKLEKNVHYVVMPRLPTDKKQRQDLILIARAGVASGKKLGRIASNMGISRYQLNKLLHNK